MKCLSIQQPWASLIAHGIKDIENRTSKMLVPPQRILIHVGAKMRAPRLLDELPLCYEIPVEFAEQIGAFDRNAPLAKSSIIGYVDVIDIVEDSKSPWVQYAMEGEKPLYHYVLANAKLFKNPIRDIKGRLGVWEIPEITDDNLPETVDLPMVERNGDTLIIPCGDALWDQVSSWDEDTESLEFEFVLTLTDANIDILAPIDENESPNNPKYVVFKSKNGRLIETEFVSSLVDDMTYSDNGESIEYQDEAGNEYVAMEVSFIVKRCTRERENPNILYVPTLG